MRSSSLRPRRPAPGRSSAAGQPAAPGRGQELAAGPIGLADGEGRQRWESARLEDLLDGLTRMEFVLRFTLSHPGLSTTIVGTVNLDHLRANLAIAERGPAARRPLRGSQTAPGPARRLAQRRLGQAIQSR